MIRHNLSAALLVVLLACLLVPAPAAARPRPAGSVLLSWLQSLLGMPAKNGCRVDPFGRCLPGTATGPTTKNGCRLDPFGRCLPGTAAGSTTTENGCGLDPFGRCLPGETASPAGENGCGVDPFGRCVH